MLVALSYPVVTALLLVAGVGGYVGARTAGRYARNVGLPVPGTSLRVRLSSETVGCGRTRSADERISRAITVALVEKRSS